MSLRRQLAIWYALIMPVLIFGVVFTARHVMMGSLRTALDESLVDNADIVDAAVSSGLTPGTSYESVVQHLKEQQLTYFPLPARVLDPAGKELATYGNIPSSVSRRLNAITSLPKQGGRFDTLKYKGADSLRVYTVAISDPVDQGPFLLVQTEDSLAPINKAEHNLWLYSLAAGAGGSIIVILVGLAIIRRGLRPLDRMSRQAQEIQSSNLRSGLPRESRPQELQRLADSLNSMWARLDEAIKSRETFMASVSHDLRTPLTALQGQIEVLQMQPTDDEVAQTLGRMAKETRRLIRMTNNLLLNAQLESKPTLSHEKIDLKKLVEEVISEEWALAGGLDFGMATSQEAAVSGDYDLLKQMLLNVVDNAIKFTPQGGRVELSLTTEEQWAVIEVSDSGKGIPREHLAHVMEPFYKLPSSGGSGGGAGLGLAIVKQIVDLHGGRIEILSGEGVGTRVIIHLPVISAEGQS